jgi:hypothetical protein
VKVENRHRVNEVRMNLILPSSREPVLTSEVQWRGFVRPVVGATKTEDFLNALTELERCVNTHLPHLHLHITVEE